MNTSFAKLGIEECETRDQGDNAACVGRKKSRKTLINDDLNCPWVL